MTKEKRPSIEPKIDDPIIISLHGQVDPKNKIVVGKERVDLKNGCLIEGDYYGFSIVNNEKNETRHYPTQCRVQGVQITDSIINIYEEGKFNPWKFDIDGVLMQSATFNYLSRKDNKYVLDNFNLEIPKGQIPVKIFNRESNVQKIVTKLKDRLQDGFDSDFDDLSYTLLYPDDILYEEMKIN